MLRHPVQLTSLEEDFKNLGLFDEQEETMTQSGAGTPAPQQKPGPSGKPAPNKTGSRNVGAQSNGDGDEGYDGNDTVPGHQGEPTGSGPTKPALPTTPGAQKESITGGDPRRQRLRGEAEDEPKGKDDDDEDDDEDEDEKDDENEEIELDGTNQVHEAISRLRGGQPKTESREEPTKLDQVAGLIEDVNNIMESIDTSRRSDALRAFANSAIISEMLARGFASFAESYEDGDLAGAAEAFATLSEDAAAIAHALEEGEEIDGEQLENEFRAQMDALMDGLDLYSDVVEADSELEEEEEPEEVEEETEEDEVEEETETETETPAEEQRFGTALIKGKFKKGPMKATTGARQAMTQSREEEVEEAPPTRATGGISSGKTESYFRHGKMGPSGKKAGGMKKEMGYRK